MLGTMCPRDKSMNTTVRWTSASLHMPAKYKHQRLLSGVGYKCQVLLHLGIFGHRAITIHYLLSHNPTCHHCHAAAFSRIKDLHPDPPADKPLVGTHPDMKMHVNI